MQEAAAKSDQGGLRIKDPHVISIERAGWRVMHKPPGGSPLQSGSAIEKIAATRMAVKCARLLADKVGETVELHTQDAKGRPSLTRYFDPTPSPEPKEGSK